MSLGTVEWLLLRGIWGSGLCSDHVPVWMVNVKMKNRWAHQMVFRVLVGLATKFSNDMDFGQCCVPVRWRMAALCLTLGGGKKLAGWGSNVEDGFT